MLTTFGCYWLGLDFQNYWNSYHIGRRYHYCWSASGLARERNWISSSAKTNIFIEIAVNSNSQTFKKSRTSLKIGVRDSVSKFMARTLLKSFKTKIDNQVQFDRALSVASNVIFKSLVVVTWGLSKWTKEKINNFCLLIVASAILSIHQVMRA